MKKIRNNINKKELVAHAFLIFVLTYMILIFGPSEIFFSNLGEFNFIYQNLFFSMALSSVFITVIVTAVVGIFPDNVKRIVTGIILGLSVAGYIQVMFLNKGLDLLGQNPNGYSVAVGRSVFNAFIWVFIVSIIVFVMIKLQKRYLKFAIYLSSILFILQFAANLQLIFTADEKAFNYGTGLYLSGEDQMKVGTENNVILIVLDYFSNQYVEPMLNVYPDALDGLKDFTYYDNYECVYFGTFPSLAHMITSYEVDASVPTKEWIYSVWNNELTDRFFSDMKNEGYVFNMYTFNPGVLTVGNGVEVLDGLFDNIRPIDNDIMNQKVDNGKLFILASRLSLFRFLPYVAKSFFYVTDPSMDVSNSKRLKTDIAGNNYDYYDRLLDEGIQIGDYENCMIVQHLIGAHNCDTGIDGMKKNESTMEETCRGCMTVLNGYLEELKKIGKYEDSTIIITADHGGMSNPQVIFFLKKPGEQHEKIQQNHVPVSHCELMPTLAHCMELSGDYGKTIFDISDESRERSYYLRWFDSNYPNVYNWRIENKVGTVNVYYEYIYEGDYLDLTEKIRNGPDKIIPMKDTVY